MIPRSLTPNGSVGAAAEMLVCADLLARGLDVFRSVSHLARCDMIASSRSTYEMVRIEVRCGRRNGLGKIVYTPKQEDLRTACDLLAIVIAGGEVVYLPDDAKLVHLNRDTPAKMLLHPIGKTT
jgi:Holliday junction resolvase-like predicted endonuclease